MISGRVETGKRGRKQEMEDGWDLKGNGGKEGMKEGTRKEEEQWRKGRKEERKDRIRGEEEPTIWRIRTCWSVLIGLHIYIIIINPESPDESSLKRNKRTDDWRTDLFLSSTAEWRRDGERKEEEKSVFSRLKRNTLKQQKSLLIPQKKRPAAQENLYHTHTHTHTRARTHTHHTHTHERTHTLSFLSL